MQSQRHELLQKILAQVAIAGATDNNFNHPILFQKVGKGRGRQPHKSGHKHMAAVRASRKEARRSGKR